MSEHSRERGGSAASGDTPREQHATGFGRTTRDLPARPSSDLPAASSPEQVRALDVQLKTLRDASSLALEDLGSLGTVQRKGEGEAPGDTLAIASRGVSGTGGALPHHDQIQASFGRHDVGQVRAHVGGAAGDAAQAIGAQAYATGNDVAFASQPDVFVAAHEAAHVVQQRAGVALKGGVGQRDDAYERHADAVAERVTRGESAEGLLDQMAGSGASAPTVQKLDQHEDVEIPDAATQADIDAELFPTTTTSGSPPLPWDGASGQPNRKRNRKAFIKEMHKAMKKHLKDAMVGIEKVRKQRAKGNVNAITSLEGAGKAAKADADAQFSGFATAAALTAVQAADRAAYAIHATGPDRNLLDAEDLGDRREAGMPIDATDLAGWISETDPDCQTARTAHHFDDRRSAEEEEFLRKQIVKPFVTKNKSKLKRYDRHGFAMSNPDTGQIVLPTTQPLGFSTTSSGGVPSDAERANKWSGWRTMVHEYIHQLEHPRLRSWPRSNRTISEGFCEYFTKKVLLPLLPTAGGADVARRTLIEGGDHGAPSAAVMGGVYDPGSYADYLAHAEAIEGHLGGAAVGAQNAMKAIFFQGHLEFLGYDDAGGAVTKAAGTHDEITVPPTITTIAALATAVNVSEADLKAANSGLSDPISGRLHAPGCREHRVVTASDGVSTSAESKSTIATQNGVTEAALTAANPGVDFTTLTAGKVLIIPKH